MTLTEAVTYIQTLAAQLAANDASDKLVEALAVIAARVKELTP